MAGPRSAPASGGGRRGVLVLGMHRSGTSALTRILNLHGAALGEDLMPAARDNPSGFWEHSAAVAIHERLLARLGMAWDDPRPLPPEWQDGEPAREALEAIDALIAREFATQRLWAVKDPRLCRFASLWRRAMEKRGIEANVVLVTRDPAEVAASLQARDGLPLAVGNLLWGRYLVDALHAAEGLPRRLVHYGELLHDWRTVIDGVDHALQLGLHRDARVEAECDRFLSPQLRHHAHGADAADALVEPLRANLDAAGPGAGIDLAVMQAGFDARLGPATGVVVVHGQHHGAVVTGQELHLLVADAGAIGAHGRDAQAVQAHGVQGRLDHGDAGLVLVEGEAEQAVRLLYLLGVVVEPA